MTDRRISLEEAQLDEVPESAQVIQTATDAKSPRPNGFLTEHESAALTLVRLCFGAGSEEFLRFGKFLVVERHGLEWLDA